MSFLKKAIKKLPGGKKASSTMSAPLAAKPGPIPGMSQAQMIPPPMASSGKASKPNSSTKTFQQPAAPQPRKWAAPTSDVPYDPNP